VQRIGLETFVVVASNFIAVASNLLAKTAYAGIALTIKFVIGANVAIFILVINYSLIRYFRAISAKDDFHHHRPTAIAISFGLFVLPIVAYAALYGIEMPQCFEEASGDAGSAATLHQVVGAIYFSTITISTLGYGDIAPAGDLARMTAALEAMNGLIAFGVFTGAVTGFMAKSRRSFARNLRRTRAPGERKARQQQQLTRETPCSDRWHPPFAEDRRRPWPTSSATQWEDYRISVIGRQSAGRTKDLSPGAP